MPKERIELSLDSETVKLLRTVAIKKYGNLRSVSRLIEDLADAVSPECGEIHREEPQINIEAIKEARAAYVKRTNMANVNCSEGFVGSCSFQPERNILCKTCGALFITYPSLSLCCPACRSLNLSYIEDDVYFKMLREERHSVQLTEEEIKNAHEEIRRENENFWINEKEKRRLKAKAKREAKKQELRQNSR